MSLIYITNHDENIYNITKTVKKDVQKKQHKYIRDKVAPPITVRAAVRITSPTKVQKRNHATMGLPEIEPPDPHDFLKKRSGKPSYSVPSAEPLEKAMRVTLKARTPKLKELLLEGNKKECKAKNFIHENVTFVKEMKPKEPEHKVVIDRVGTAIIPERQGLEPVYIKKPIFGKTPKYLVRFNKMKEKEYQMRKDLSGKQQPKCHYITRDEREQLLRGLKKNWEELQKQYQGLPILTDTIPKKVKKSKLEADLKQLEKDIVLVERHPYIYVYNDTDLQ